MSVPWDLTAEQLAHAREQAERANRTDLCTGCGRPYEGRPQDKVRGPGGRGPLPFRDGLCPWCRLDDAQRPHDAAARR